MALAPLTVQLLIDVGRSSLVLYPRNESPHFPVVHPSRRLHLRRLPLMMDKPRAEAGGGTLGCGFDSHSSSRRRRDSSIRESAVGFSGDTLLASSAESVGEFWFGQVAKCVIQSDFQCPGGAEPIRPFGDHSGLSVEAFDNATGELPPGSEPVQNQVAVRAQPCGQPPSSGRAASASSGCTSGRGTGRPSTATRSPTAIESPP